MFGGEFHYWRTPPEAWPQVFRSIKKLGFNTVSTYVPWDFHEVRPGRYDFSGKTSAAHDLLRWLALAKANRLQVILRPGPYIYAEWNHKGPPARIARHARLSPAFLKASRQWIAAVAKAVKPFLATQGGPITMVQVCNEVTGLFELEKGYADPKFREIQKIIKVWARRKGFPINRWQLPEIPHHWGGSHLDVPKRLPKDKAERFLAFNEWYTEEYLRQMTAIFKEAGFSTPLCSNVVSWYWPQNWRTLQEITGGIAMDTYYPHGLPGNLPLAFAKLYRQFCRVANNPMAIEFGMGVWDGMEQRLGTCDERHMQLTALLALSQGLRGINFYMLVGRDNWSLSAINEWGRVRERFIPALALISKLVKILGSGSFRPARSVGLVWRRRDHLDFVLSGGMFDHNYFGKEWFEQHDYEADYAEQWAAYQVLIREGYDVEIVDADETEKAWPRVTVFPVTRRWDGFCKEISRRHLKRGGSLVLLGKNSADLAMEFTPGIGTPVQKWVRDVSLDQVSKLPSILQGMGEDPLRVLEGKHLLQFVRSDARGRRLLFVFSMSNEKQKARLNTGRLKDLAGNAVYQSPALIDLGPREAKAFWAEVPIPGGLQKPC